MELKESPSHPFMGVFCLFVFLEFYKGSLAGGGSYFEEFKKLSKDLFPRCK